MIPIVNCQPIDVMSNTPPPSMALDLVLPTTCVDYCMGLYEVT